MIFVFANYSVRVEANTLISSLSVPPAGHNAITYA